MSVEEVTRRKIMATEMISVLAKDAVSKDEMKEVLSMLIGSFCTTYNCSVDEMIEKIREEFAVSKEPKRDGPVGAAKRKA